MKDTCRLNTGTEALGLKVEGSQATLRKPQTLRSLKS